MGKGVRFIIFSGQPFQKTNLTPEFARKERIGISRSEPIEHGMENHQRIRRAPHNSITDLRLADHHPANFQGVIQDGITIALSATLSSTLIFNTPGDSTRVHPAITWPMLLAFNQSATEPE
jgi:hypothetical protein